MKFCRAGAALAGVSVLLMLGLGGAQAADDPCAPKRLDWMLDQEKCGDLVFADVAEIMLTCDDAQMRLRAAAGLGRFRGPEVFASLYRVLEGDRSPLVREAALNAHAAIMRRMSLMPGRETMEACFLVYQFDRYRPNRDRARELLERFEASPQMLAQRSYVSARYRPLAQLQVRASADSKSALIATLQPADAFAIADEFHANDQRTCWFAIETPAGLKGWVCGLQDGREQIATDDVPPRPFVSTVESLAEVANPAQSLKLELRTGKKGDTFRPGEEIVFFVKAAQDCYVTLIYFSPQSGGYMLFPNRDQSDALVRAGTEVRIPAEGSSLNFKASTPGVEEISVIATRFPVEIFPDEEVEPGAVRAIKTGRREMARGIDRLLRYFKTDAWATVHRTIQTKE